MSTTTPESTAPSILPGAVLPPLCAARVAAVQALAAAHGITGTMTDARIIGHRLAWDAHAAGEYPRPALDDAASLAALVPDLAAAVWHAVAGATVLGPWCCDTPGAHRDRMARLGVILRDAGRVR